MTACYPEVLYAIGAELNIPNERITVEEIHGGYIWVTTPVGRFSARLTAGNKRLRKNTVRREH